jgi:hypothetical protein
MDAEKHSKIDREALEVLRSLLEAAQVCLNGMEAKLKEDVQMIGVIDTMIEKALNTVNETTRRLNADPD